MKKLLSTVTITVHEKLYVKDPTTSELGKKIIEHSILLIDDIGFDDFTFKKLGERIHSNESSIYRYFENKHKLLLYLSSWYWAWIEYRLVFETNNISDARKRLMKAITIVTEKITDDSNTVYINEAILNKIIISEFNKTWLTKEIDEENKIGFFLVYKRVIKRITDMILAVNPSYEYATSLASSIIEGALHQHYLVEHLSTITDCNEHQTPTAFYLNLIEKIV
ncbi:TetR/AcrR family transcriptional regulator [Flavobacterium aciduliphilum]|nr:TetR/AcrR family transcriptional regulator [Flavobacterium aciduliphilum]